MKLQLSNYDLCLGVIKVLGFFRVLELFFQNGIIGFK